MPEEPQQKGVEPSTVYPLLAALIAAAGVVANASVGGKNSRIYATLLLLLAVTLYLWFFTTKDRPHWATYGKRIITLCLLVFIGVCFVAFIESWRKPHVGSPSQLHGVERGAEKTLSGKETGSISKEAKNPNPQAKTQAEDQAKQPRFKSQPPPQSSTKPDYRVTVWLPSVDASAVIMIDGRKANAALNADGSHTVYVPPKSGLTDFEFRFQDGRAWSQSRGITQDGIVLYPAEEATKH